MGPRIGFRRTAAISAAAVVGVTSTIVLASGAAQASPSFGYSAFSYGTYVVSGVVDHGPQVRSFFACTRRVGVSQTNELATADLNKTAIAYSVKTSTASHNDKRGDGTTSYGSASEISVGSLELTGVTTSATAVYKDGGFKTAAATKFSGVKIAGVNIPTLLNPAPNTKVPVPGLGYVVFNRVVYEHTPTSASASSAAVLIHSTVKNKYVPKGATVAVLLTKAEVGGPAKALVRGKAYASKATVGGVVRSGAMSYQSTCLGTNGEDKTDAAAGVDAPYVGEMKGVHTTKNGLLQKDLSQVSFRAGASGANLFGGKIHVGAIESYAFASKKDGKYAIDSASKVASLLVNGKAIPVPSLPNQKVSIPDLGVITFNKTTTSKGFVSVTAMEINLPSLRTIIEIGHSEAGIVG